MEQRRHSDETSCSGARAEANDLANVRPRAMQMQLPDTHCWPAGCRRRGREEGDDQQGGTSWRSCARRWRWRTLKCSVSCVMIAPLGSPVVPGCGGAPRRGRMSGTAFLPCARDRARRPPSPAQTSWERGRTTTAASQACRARCTFSASPREAPHLWSDVTEHVRQLIVPEADVHRRRDGPESECRPVPGEALQYSWAAQSHSVAALDAAVRAGSRRGGRSRRPVSVV